MLARLGLYAREGDQRKGEEGEREGEYVLVFRGCEDGDGDEGDLKTSGDVGVGGKMDLEEDGRFDFDGFEPPTPPPNNFHLAEGLLFLFLASSCSEPRVDELHLDLRTFSSLLKLGKSSVCSEDDADEGDGVRENGGVVGA